MIEPSEPALFERYLRLLGIQKRKPSLDALNELVQACAMRVPFECISKLYYKNHDNFRFIPDFKKYLDGIEQYNFGGTCYSNNYYLHLLLIHLGYEVKLCGADMSTPDAHIVNIVSLEGREFIVDNGYAAPFLKPLPRDLDDDYIVGLGNSRYVLHPRDNDGNSRLDLYRDGQLKHGYTAKPIHRPIEYFESVIKDSFRDSATFMNSVLLVRLFPRRSLVIYNQSVIESEGIRCTVRDLENRDELPAAVEKYFSIPKEIVAEAIVGLGELGDAWS